MAAGRVRPSGKRPQSVNQPRPWHHLLHLGQKFVASQLLFLTGVFRLRKLPAIASSSVSQTDGFYPMPAPEAEFSVFP
jgi:hypothetical protein